MVQHVVRVGIAGRDLDVQVPVGVKAVHNRDGLPVLGVDLAGYVLDLHLRLSVGGDVELSRLAADHLVMRGNRSTATRQSKAKKRDDREFISLGHPSFSTKRDEKAPRGAYSTFSFESTICAAPKLPFSCSFSGQAQLCNRGAPNSGAPDAVRQRHTLLSRGFLHTKLILHAKTRRCKLCLEHVRCAPSLAAKQSPRPFHYFATQGLPSRALCSIAHTLDTTCAMAMAGRSLRLDISKLWLLYSPVETGGNRKLYSVISDKANKRTKAYVK